MLPNPWTGRGPPACGALRLHLRSWWWQECSRPAPPPDTGHRLGQPSGKVRNTLLATGPGVETSYDKVHLFDAFGFLESDTVDPGTEPVTFDAGGLTFGLATCYDIRFPALFTANAERGAEVNVVCASWASGPGKVDQWQLLARARALDSTTYVLACGQGDPATQGVPAKAGSPTGVGHSAVVSPFGDVLDELDGAPGCSSQTWTPPWSRKPAKNSPSWQTAGTSKPNPLSLNAG